MFKRFICVDTFSINVWTQIEFRCKIVSVRYKYVYFIVLKFKKCILFRIWQHCTFPPAHGVCIVVEVMEQTYTNRGRAAGCIADLLLIAAGSTNPNLQLEMIYMSHGINKVSCNVFRDNHSSERSAQDKYLFGYLLTCGVNMCVERVFALVVAGVFKICGSAKF